MTVNKGGRPPITPEEKRRRLVEHHFAKILSHLVSGLGEKEVKKLDLLNTPLRVSKMLVHELLSYPEPPSEDELCIAAVDRGDIVTVGPIGFSSICAHHVLPFTGHAWISYLADTKVMGLSKFTRVVKAFSKRFQIQEVLTRSILEYLVGHLDPVVMIVQMRAQHGCIACRGVEDPLQQTVTSALYYYGENEKNAEPPTSIVAELYRNIDRATPNLK